jgi:hypothetical protein
LIYALKDYQVQGKYFGYLSNLLKKSTNYCFPVLFL